MVPRGGINHFGLEQGRVGPAGLAGKLRRLRRVGRIGKLRLLKFLFVPGSEWERITKPGSYLQLWFVLLISIVPLLAASCLVEGYGLMRLGEKHEELSKLIIPEERIIRYEVFYAVATLVVLFITSALFKMVSSSFNVRTPFSNHFALLAYAFAPIILMHMPDGIPAIDTWICWGIGIALGIRILYHGIGVTLQPEQTKGFGLLLMSIVFVAAGSLLVHFASVAVLNGQLLKGS